MKFVVSLIAIAVVGSVTFVVLLELLLSGGGSAQDLSQGPKAGQSKQERTGGEKAKQERTGGEKAKQEGEELEWVAGVVLKAAYDKHAVVVKPDDGERQPFTYKPENVEITLDGKEVEPDAIDEGQRVSIGYEMVTTNKDREVNVAQFIKLEPKKGSPGDESTG